MLSYVELFVCCHLIRRHRTNLVSHLQLEFDLDIDVIYKVMTKLAKKDWLQRAIDPNDGRRKEYDLNPKKEAEIATAIDAWRLRLAPVADLLKPPPKGELTDLTANDVIPRTPTLDLLIFLQGQGTFTTPLVCANGFSRAGIAQFAKRKWITPTGKVMTGQQPTIYKLTELGQQCAWTAICAIKAALSCKDNPS